MPFIHSSPCGFIIGRPNGLTNLGLNEEKYEMAYRVIIERFRCYPHRNQILGRKTTVEEEQFLKTHKGF